MSHKISSPAIKLDQPGLKGGQQIYATSLLAKDLIDTTMFKVDFWKKEEVGKKDQGYQRSINDAHTQKVERYLSQDDAILPAAVLLSSRDKKINWEKNELIFNDYPLYIVDGQHRIAGLRNSIENSGNENWIGSKLPVILLSGFTKLEEMEQFVTLNNTQKKVETNLALELMYDLSQSNKQWKEAYIQSGNDWKVRAIKLVNELNANPHSPWQNQIKIANEKKNTKHVASANSFATSLKPLVSKGAFEYNRKVDDNVKIISNFWGALRNLFIDAFLDQRHYAIQKTPGLFTLHTLLQAILTKKGYDFGQKKDDLKNLLLELFKEAEVDTEFWRSDKSDGVTMYGSMKGFRILSDRFIEALNKIV